MIYMTEFTGSLNIESTLAQSEEIVEWLIKILK